MKPFFFVILIFFCTIGFSQNADSASVLKTQDSLAFAKQTKKKTYSYARRASIMSAVLPGLGQVYNRKVWKVPIIYTGLGGFGYMFLQNNKEFKYYRNAVRKYYGDDVAALANTNYTGEQLQSEKLYYRKNRDLCAFGFAIIYFLNIIDANVDGHLRTFDVSDDLSLRIDPWQNIHKTNFGYSSTFGLSLKLNFR
ncbi:MAG: hypothetical protein KF900_14830 [Bacteroidetes bacterium]|nr:hypothetical protein [Bacteroidota bacterium]